MLNRWKASNNAHLDGVAKFCKDKAEMTSFGATQNVSKLADLEVIASAPFAEMSARAQDSEWASERGIELSRKIKTRRIPAIQSGLKVIIKNRLYDISYIDYSTTEMYVYLEGEREIDT